MGNRTRRGPGGLLLTVAAGTVFVIIAAVIGTGIWTTVKPDHAELSTTVIRTPTAAASSPAAGEDEDDVAAVPTKDSEMDPACWTSFRAAGREDCQLQVAERTSFIDRYRQGQPAISRKHPDTGSEKALARHGLEICHMAGRRDYSLIKMIVRFMTDYHAHPGPVTEGAAAQVQAIAVTSICPGNVAAYEAKGGAVG